MKTSARFSNVLTHDNEIWIWTFETMDMDFRSLISHVDKVFSVSKFKIFVCRVLSKKAFQSFSNERVPIDGFSVHFPPLHRQWTDKNLNAKLKISIERDETSNGVALSALVRIC